MPSEKKKTLHKLNLPNSKTIHTFVCFLEKQENTMEERRVIPEILAIQTKLYNDTLYYYWIELAEAGECDLPKRASTLKDFITYGRTMLDRMLGTKVDMDQLKEVFTGKDDVYFIRLHSKKLADEMKQVKGLLREFTSVLRNGR